MSHLRTWRDQARPVIARVIDQVGFSNQSSLRKALYDAYPFGQRKHYPYRVWLDEIKKQVGKAMKDIKNINEPVLTQMPAKQLALF